MTVGHRSLYGVHHSLKCAGRGSPLFSPRQENREDTDMAITKRQKGSLGTRLDRESKRKAIGESNPSRGVDNANPSSD